MSQSENAMNPPASAFGRGLPLRFDLLTAADIERIFESSLRVLAETGIILHYPPARALLQEHGAQLDEIRELVRIPRQLVEEALKLAPRRVTVYGQGEHRDCHLYLDGPRHGRTTTGLNWILDPGAVERRAVTKMDVVDWTRIIHALPSVHFAGSLNDQEDAAKSEEVRCLARMLHHTDKPFMFSAFSGEGMRWLWRLTEVSQPTGRLPRLMVLSSVNSPLVYGWGQCEAAMVSAELGIPVCLNSSAVAGATAPVTLAGNLVQMNAEILAALTILQLHRPGAPVVYAAHPMALDMKTGMASISVPEVGLMSAACIAIGRYYGLPTASNGICTDACTPDPMATLEKWSNGYLPFMAGANVNGGAGSLACVGTVSLQQLVIDNDVYGHFFRHMQGVALDDERLAAEVIARVGPGNAYLMDDHTLKHFRDEYYRSPLANRLSAPAWEAAGAHDTLERASDSIRSILAAPPHDYLSGDQSREIEALLAEAEASLATMEVRI
jgi:trimethylamine---corrinoid protein Co-methyltransferase